MKPVRSVRGARRAALFALTALLIVPAFAGRDRSAGDATLTYSGRAVAFHVDGVQEPVAGPIVIGDTGALPGSGGVVEKHATDVSLYGGALTIDGVDAVVAGVGSATTVATALSNYHVHFITQDGKDVFIAADFIGASAAVAVDGGGQARGSARVVIQGLTVNGKAVRVTGAANQVVEFPEDEVKLVLNERVDAGGQGRRDVAAAAIHFYICECMEGHFGLVSAGISGRAQPGGDHDCGKLTGGGWITGTPAGAKGTFGVSGGLRRGDCWGHLTYVDHGMNLKVESTAVTGFQVDPADANARIISYNVTINGAAGTATVRVADYGEPGRNDTFAITLSTGYSASGDLGGTRPGGGNIQNHPCPPGWE